MKLLSSLLLVVSTVAWGGAVDWESSPRNWDNSPNNWSNSSRNWENSPRNWENSPRNYGNDRIIRDNLGNPQGYVVPRQDGGANIFNMDGSRRGYLPTPQR